MKPKHKILLFLLFFLGIHFIVSFGFNLYVSKKSMLVESQKLALEEKNNRFLFIGDSHPTRSIDGDKIPGVVKLTYYGQGPVLSYFRLKDYLMKCENHPEYLFVQADITHYSANYMTYIENKFFYSGIIDYEELYSIGAISLDRYLMSYSYRLFPYMEWRSLLRKNKKKKKAKDKIRFSELSPEQRAYKTEQFVMEQLLTNDPGNLYSHKALYYLEKIIKLCEEHRIKIIAVKYPITNYYWNKLLVFCGKKAMQTPPQDKMLRDYNIPIMDFELMYEYDYDLFFDSHHMNEKGREVFTELISKELEKL